MPAANSVVLEGRVGKGITHYPARDGKKEFVSFSVNHGDGWFMVQAYDELAAVAASSLAEGKWVFVAGMLRASKAKGRCGTYHRFTNVLAARIEVREAGPRDRRELLDEESLGEAPTVW